MLKDEHGDLPAVLGIKRRRLCCIAVHGWKDDLVVAEQQPGDRLRVMTCTCLREPVHGGVQLSRLWRGRQRRDRFGHHAKWRRAWRRRT